MKPTLVAAILGVSTILSGITLFSDRSRSLVLGWLSVGLCQSAFLLVVGFELLALLNVLFVAATATVLQLYSALFGTEAIYESERIRTRQDWVYGIGTGTTLGAILLFALIGTLPEGTISPDLETSIFAKKILGFFPELPWIIGVILFLLIVVSATVGRPGWKRLGGGSR